MPREALRRAAKEKEEMTKSFFVSGGRGAEFTEEAWNRGEELYMLFKNKTTGEGRTLIMGIERDNGWEAWRALAIRYEPQAGIRRMREMADLNALQMKRCKNASETMLIISEIDRRKRRIDEIGGDPPSNDTLVSILWVAMDAQTRTHVSAAVDMDVLYPDLRLRVMKHANLVCATGGTRSATAMDISSIESVANEGSKTGQQQPQQPNWGEESWSPEETAAWQESEEYLNALGKGGKGKGGKGCFNCGKLGHQAWQCKEPKTKGLGKGMGSGAFGGELL